MNSLIHLMRRFLPVMLAVGMASPSVFAAEAAGRVLVAVGETFVQRSGRDVRLERGAAVEAGDVLRVGEASNLQVRFSDEAVVALRSNTLFRIDDYKFANQADADKSVFSLLKGGLRTVTGIIGRASRQNYAVKSVASDMSVTATIGVRGTHFTVVNCNSDCNNADGSRAANGTYGSVTDGRIVATNQGGEREFGKNEYFHVASAAESPQPLLAPPSFLRDKLEGAARNAPKRQAAAETTAPAQEAAGSLSGDGVLAATATTSIATVALATTVPTLSTQQQAIADTATANKIFRVSNELNAPNNFDMYDSGYQNTTASTLPGVPVGQQGSNIEAGNVVWGVGGWGTSSTCAAAGRCHWAYGTDTPSAVLPTSGIVTYAHVGGTTPTDALGNAGVVTQGGVLQVNFGTSTMSMPTALQYTVNGHNYSVSFANKVYNDFFSMTGAGFCTNCGGQNITVGVYGTAVGASAQGALLSVGTSAGGAITESTGTVQVYKK